MKQIESYHISKSEYGVITLIINTVDKWVNYEFYSLSNGCFLFNVLSEDSEVLEKQVNHKSEFDFDEEKEIKYLRLEQQEDDQIVFYWIPLRLIKGDEYVKHFKSKTYELDKQVQ